MNEQHRRQVERDLEYIQERCRANAEIAREDPDRRRRTMSIQLRNAAQAEDRDDDLMGAMGL